MEIITLKTKEMVLGRLATTNLPLLSIYSQTIDRVTLYKLLGAHVGCQSILTISPKRQRQGCTFYYKNINWLQFLFIVKAAILKQQISKFYPQIISCRCHHHSAVS